MGWILMVKIEAINLAGRWACPPAGAILNGGNGNITDSVRFYEYQATTDKNLQSGLVIDSETASDAFGSSVSISGDGLAFAVGAVDYFVFCVYGSWQQ